MSGLKNDVQNFRLYLQGPPQDRTQIARQCVLHISNFQPDSPRIGFE